MQTIDVQTLASKQTNEAVELIDVRTPVEFREVHAVGARNIPLDTINPQQIISQRNGNSDQPLYLICKSGSRSAKAAEKFISAGIENVISVQGGTSAWDQAGLPVRRGKKAISLERQVRIVAGMITLLGSIAAIATGNVYFAGIPAFIGAGLTFAGITDTCGMGMVLAKMPWNQCDTGSSCSV